MRKVYFGLALVVCVVLVMSPVVWSWYAATTSEQKLEVVPTYEPDLEEAFERITQTSSPLNTGLRIQRIPLSASSGEPPPSLKNIVFVVFNFTDEAVEFKNQVFGARLYVADAQTKAWEEVTLSYHPEDQATILPPKLERLDLKVWNTWTFAERELANVNHKIVRAYIVGRGQQTGITYGAYLDARIAP